MRIVVTGGAGFVGGHFVELLLNTGHRVTVLDALRPQYDTRDRRRLMAQLAAHALCECHEVDIVSDDLDRYMAGADVAVHLAARSGVSESWSDAFVDYALDNLAATNRLLGAVIKARVPRVVLASSSSVYGTRPISQLGHSALSPRHPYGVSKLAAEHVCRVHAALSTSLEVAVLRYFTIYGPRQRPDMAVSRFITAADAGEPIEVRGTGAQSRRFTYVGDAAAATLKACTAELRGVEAFDIASGQTTTVITLAHMVEELTGRRVEVRHGPPEAGEPYEVAADVDVTRCRLGWQAATTLDEGLNAQIRWFRDAK